MCICHGVHVSVFMPVADSIGQGVRIDRQHLHSGSVGARGTGSVGDSVGEGARMCCSARVFLVLCLRASVGWTAACTGKSTAACTRKSTGNCSCPSISRQSNVSTDGNLTSQLHHLTPVLSPSRPCSNLQPLMASLPVTDALPPRKRHAPMLTNNTSAPMLTNNTSTNNTSNTSKHLGDVHRGDAAAPAPSASALPPSPHPQASKRGPYATVCVAWRACSHSIPT